MHLSKKTIHLQLLTEWLLGRLRITGSNDGPDSINEKHIKSFWLGPDFKQNSEAVEKALGLNFEIFLGGIPPLIGKNSSRMQSESYR